MQIVYLDLNLMEKMCHRVAVAVFNQESDPIPPFSTHTEQLLDSALNLPKQTFGGADLYKTLTDKAIILYYALIKNHPFPNGNKRMATASLLVFLFINNYWLETTPAELAEWAIKVAESKQKDPMIVELGLWLEGRIKKVDIQ